VIIGTSGDLVVRLVLDFMGRSLLSLLW